MDRKRASWLIFGCFFLSGTTSLVYEVVWLRLLIRVFGGTTLAVSTVLTVFLGGLALGGYLFGRYADRLAHVRAALLCYAALELGIGLYGLLTFLLFQPAFLGPIWKVLSTFFVSFPLLSYLLRFLFVSTILIFPTMLMGATFPVLSKSMVALRHRMIFDIGKLYAINTAGAVMGTLGAGLFLLPTFGIGRTMLITAVLNGMIALIAVFLSCVRRPDAVPEPTHAGDGISLSSPTMEPADEATGFSPRAVNIVLICFAFSGFNTLLLEVAWTRTLTLVLGSSVYAFTTMLGTFLTGLTVGSYYMTHFNAYVKRPIRVLAVIQVLLGLSVFATLFLFTELPWWYLQLARQYQKTWNKFLLAQLGLAGLIMFLPTFFSGMVFPLVARIYTRGRQTVGKRVGEMYAINTLGSICGSFATGFFLIPLLSIHWTIILGMSISLVLGGKLLTLALVDLQPHRSPRPFLYKSVLHVACGAVVVVLLLLHPGWPRRLMSSGVFVNYRQTFQYTTKEQFLADTAESSKHELLYYKEGLSTVVSVEKIPGANAIYLKTNGKGEGGVPINPRVPFGGGDMVTQVLLSELPLLLHQGVPEHLLVVGFGTGTTAGSALNAPEVKQVTIAELEAAVLEAASNFRPANGEPLSQANLHSGRVRPIITDGRNYLLTTSEKFDIIISQPSEPWISGAADLFTREYWQLGRDHLKPHGLFCQWLQLYSIDTGHLEILLKTFATVFPRTFVFRPGSAGELLLIGARDSLKVDVGKIKSRLAHTTVKADLGRIGLYSVVDVVSQLLMVPEDVARFTQYARVNTDDNMLVEYGTPKTIDRSIFSIRELFDELGEAIHADKTAYLVNYGNGHAKEHFLVNLVASYKKKVALGPPDQLRSNPYIRSAMQVIGQLNATFRLPEIHFASGELYGLVGETNKAREQFAQVFRTEPKTAESYIARGNVYYARQEIDNAIVAYEQALQLDPKNTTAVLRLAVVDLVQKKFTEAYTKLIKAEKLDPGNADVYSALGNYYQLRKQYDQAVVNYEKAVDRDRYHLIAYDNLGKIYYAAKYYIRAYLAFDVVRRLNPYYAEPYFYMGEILASRNEPLQAIAFLTQYLQLDPGTKRAQAVRERIAKLQTTNDRDR